MTTIESGSYNIVNVKWAGTAANLPDANEGTPITGSGDDMVQTAKVRSLNFVATSTV